MRSKTEGCGRVVTDKEILDAIANSEGCAWRPGAVTSSPSVSKWPSPDKDRICATIDRHGLSVADLWERSPVRFSDHDKPATEDIIDEIFPADSLLCTGKSKSDFATRTREEWRGKLARRQLITPSPMTAKTGRRKGDGAESEHTLDNTGPRRFLIAEFDTGATDDHASLLWDLATRAPLTMVVFSGSKSLHGWFWTDGITEDRIRRFMRDAVELGADRATWTRSQFVRMPDAMRDNGERQSVLYFNPNVVK